MLVSFELAVLISVYTPPWWWIVMLFCFCCIPKRLAGDRLGKGEGIKSGMLGPWKRSFGFLCLFTFILTHSLCYDKYLHISSLGWTEKKLFVGYDCMEGGSIDGAEHTIRVCIHGLAIERGVEERKKRRGVEGTYTGPYS